MSSSSTPSFPSSPNQRILNKHFVSQIVSEPVKEFRISAGSKHGDNVAGKLLCLDVKTQSNEIHNLVLKSILPMTGTIDKNVLTEGEMLAESRAFPREIIYYTELVPMLKTIADKHPRFSLFSRPIHYSSYTNKENGLYDYIALEDLRPSGYKMLDKNKGLNVEQMDAVLKELAIFHAVSYCLLNGKLANNKFIEMKNDPKSLLNLHSWDNMSKFFNNLVSGMIEIVGEMGMAGVASKMDEKFSTTGYQTMIDLSEKTGKEDKYFTVLIHTDLWTNNILVKMARDGKTVEDVKFIDFQGVRFGNIYEDLHYLIFTSTTADFRKNHLKSSLKKYFQEFYKVLVEVGCPMPRGFTEEEIFNVFHENWEYGAVYNLVTIPFQQGMQPPPPSPMTPIDVDMNGQNKSAFFSQNSTDREENDGPVDSDKYEADINDALLKGTRNSHVAMKWLKELVEEMIENNLI